MFIRVIGLHKAYRMYTVYMVYGVYQVHRVWGAWGHCSCGLLTFGFDSTRHFSLWKTGFGADRAFVLSNLHTEA